MKRWGGAALIGLALAALAACSGGGDSGSSQGQLVGASGDGSVEAAQQGEQLSQAAAATLEKKLQATPGDLTSREQLVGFYFVSQALLPEQEDKAIDPHAPVMARDRHLLWLIQNAPALELLGTSPVGVVAPAPDPPGYAAARAEWSSKVAGPAPPQVRGNAGIFFAQTQDPRAAALLEAAEAGDPQNAAWPAALGELDARLARSAAGSPASRQDAAAAVRELESAWRLSGGASHDAAVSQMAKLAVVAAEYDKAAQYANLLLNTFRPGGGQSPLTIGGPIHDGNMVLGEVALHNGDRASAAQYLLKAGATPGSPQLNQFGPNFMLARDLLAAGSRDIVLQYCDEVGKFWGDGRLARWRAAIAAGQTPDFGENLWV